VTGQTHAGQAGPYVPRPRPGGPVTLLVSSPGGHLVELIRLAARLRPAGENVWVTPRTDEAELLLTGERVRWVPDVPPRDLRAALAHVPVARRLLREVRPDLVVSTGAAIALPYLALAGRSGAAGHYIESAARPHVPSLTGRLLTHAPGVRLHTQGAPAWPGWESVGSVFDEYASGLRAGLAAPWGPVLVTLGTQRFPFPRVVERLAALLPPRVPVTWQTGHTPLPPGVDQQPFLTRNALQRALLGASVVVAHAGVGTALAALDVGLVPVLVPRRASYREHVDDHQALTARRLAERGLAVTAEADELTLAHLELARGLQAERSPERGAPLHLAAGAPAGFVVPARTLVPTPVGSPDWQTEGQP